MNARVKFGVAVTVLAGYVLLAGFAIGAGVRSSVGPEERETLDRVLRSQWPFLSVAAVLLVGGFALLVARFFVLYVFPLGRLAGETRLVASTNPGHRLDVPRPAELGALADAVNELAQRYQSSEENVASRVAAAHTELEQERNRLAALMSELTIPVIVCNVEGRILLYNAAARDLLGGSATVGLGRSVFGVVDRSLVGHALDRIRAGAGPTYAAMTASGDRLLRVRVALVSSGDETTGFVLTLEDLTRQATASDRRETLVRTLTQGTRRSLANIRAAVETVADYPEMEADRQRRFVEIIREEAGQLSDRVDQAAAESERSAPDSALLEDVLARDLLDAIANRLLIEPGSTASVEEPAEELWLSVDGYGVVGAVVELVRRLRFWAGEGSVRLTVGPGERYAALDVRWDGAPLDPADVRAWQELPPVRAVLERHSAEAWSAADGRGPYVRLLLPCAETPPLPATAAVAPAPPAAWSAVSDRPEFYDFDLFRVRGNAAEWDARRLDDLAYTVFDTETTGLNPAEGDEIIAVGAVRVVNRRLLRQETFERLVDPRREIPAASYAVHGISSTMLRGQPVIEEVLPEFARFAEETVLVGHDVAFDLRFLAIKEAQTAVRFTQPVLDTLLLSALVHPEQTEHSLEAIAARLGVSVIGRHTALGDALVTGAIFVRLLSVLEQRGLRTLGAVRAAARQTAQARRSEALYAHG